MVVPESLTEYFIGAKLLADRHCSEIHQVILTEFLRSGSYEKHLQRTRKLYKENCRTLTKELKKQFGSTAKVLCAERGLHLVLEFAAPFDDAAFCSWIASWGGIDCLPLSECCTDKVHFGLILGYGGMTTAQIRHYAAKLFDGWTAFERQTPDR